MNFNWKKVAVIGGTGNTGKVIAAQLRDAGYMTIVIARTAVNSSPAGIICRTADAGGDKAQLQAALEDVDCVINAAHARYTRNIIAALPSSGTRLITLGSTRKFTRFPDQKAADVSDAEDAHRDAHGNGLIIHPTMIYGGQDNNIRRLAGLIRKLPVLPLPLGGQALMQPVHRDDVARAACTAACKDVGEGPITLPGGQALSYREIVTICGEAVGRRPCIIAVPASLLGFAAPLTGILPFLPTIGPDEVRRLTEDKDFDVTPAARRLGFTPIGFAEGIARMRAAGELAV